MSGTRAIYYRRVAVLLGAATAAGGGIYIAYKVSNSEYYRRQRQRVRDAWILFSRLYNAVFAASELSTTVLTDVRAFIESDSDEVPRSVRQILKLSSSEEFQRAVVRTTYSVTEGVLHGVCLSSAWNGPDETACPAQCTNGAAASSEISGMRVRRMGLVESVLDKLFTDEGRSFASAVVGKAMRSLVVSLVDKLSSPPGGVSASGGATGASSAAGSRQALTGWELILVELATNEKGKALLTDIVATFAVNAVGTFIEKTRNVNVYHDILAAVSRHQELVKDVGAHILTRTAETTVATAMAPLPPERPARQGGSASAGMGAGFEEVIQTGGVSVALSTSSDGSSSEAPSPSESLSPRSRISLDGQLQDAMWQGVPDATISAPQTAAVAAAAAAASSASLCGKLTTFFRRLPPPPPPALQAASTSASAAFSGSQALSSTWQRQLAGFLAEKEVRGLVVEVAGAVSARGMRAFLLVLFHNLLSSQSSRAVRGKGEAAGSSMLQHPGVRSRIQVVSGGDEGEQGGDDVTADDDLALEASELERVAEVCGRQARASAARALTVASCCLALVMHCMMGLSSMST
ncbi:unnamed protein product [Closterium sp. Yama58-4]|nr:unnamed protein product [Closterium sp. Yama58-4]